MFAIQVYAPLALYDELYQSILKILNVKTLSQTLPRSHGKKHFEDDGLKSKQKLT